MKQTPIHRQFFVRNVDARSLIDTFLVASVVSIFAVRLYLYIAGYPQIGHGNYHIAHMLWGGLLMLIAFVLALEFFGRRLMALVAIVSGLGFGIFIDEIGKFITRDNNYFFQPSIGIIYATLMLVYIMSLFLDRPQRLSDEERKLNALRLLEDAVRNDLDPLEKQQIRELLASIKTRDDVTVLLEEFLEKIDTIEQPTPNFIQNIQHSIHRRYVQFWRLRYTSTLVKVTFGAIILLTILMLFSSVLVDIHSLSGFLFGQSKGTFFLKGQLVSTALALGCMIIGLGALTKSRALGFRWFYAATLINILLTQFFIFARYQFAALWVLTGQIVLLGLIKLVLAEERRGSNV